MIELDPLVPYLGAASVIAGVISLYKGWTYERAFARRIVRESFPVLCIAIVLDVLAGTVVEPRMETVFLVYPALLIVVPGFLENTGALGSVLAARLGSKLHLGAVSPNAKPQAAALLDGTVVLALGATVYLLTSVATLGLSELTGAAHPGVGRFVGATLFAGLLATLVAAVIGYYAAITTYRFGLDPDNHTIPLVTSGMDLLGVICLVVGLVVFGIA
jgi:mgtE-like transporter